MKHRFKTRTYIFAGVVALAVILYLALFHLGLMEYLVNRQLNKLISDKFTARVHIGGISGNYYSNLLLNNLRITFDDGEETYNLATIPEVAIEYSFIDIWSGNLVFKRIYIDSASLSLRQNSEGHWLLPRPKVKMDEDAGSAEFELQELGLNNLTFRLISNTDSLIFDDIILKAHVMVLEGTYAIDVDALSYESSDKRLNLTSGGGKATLTGDHLLFEDIFLITAKSHVKMSGQAVLQKSPYAKFDIDADNLNLKEFTSLLGISLNGDLAIKGALEIDQDKLSGNILLSGEFLNRSLDSLVTEFSYADRRFNFDTINGLVFNGCLINATGFMDIGFRPESYQLTGQLKDFNLNNLVPGSFDTDFDGLVDLNGSGLKGENLVIDLRAELIDSYFDIYHGHQAAGSATITTDSIIFHDGFQINYGRNRFMASGKIDYGGDISISGTAICNDLTVFDSLIFIRKMGGRAYFMGEITGVTANPDLKGKIRSDSLWIYDIFSSVADIDLSVERFLFDRQGTVNVRLYGGSAYDIPMDTCELKIDVDPQNAEINDFRFYNSYCTADATGRFAYDNYPQLLTIDEIAIDLFDLAFDNQRPILIDIDSTGYSFSNSKLVRPVGYISWAGRVNYDETIDMRIDGQNMVIDPWVNLLTDEYDLGGRLSGATHISGPFGAPQIRFDGGIDSLRYEKLILGNLRAIFNYSERKVNIDSVILKSDEGTYTARGQYPIDLALIKISDRFPEEEQSVTINAADKRFDLVSLLFDEVEDMTGDFVANAKLTGTPLKPRIDGEATITDGRLKLYDLILPLENLEVKLKMIGNTIYVDNASAICKNGRRETGTVEASGTVSILSIDNFGYDMKVDALNFPGHYELGDVNGVLDADLRILGETPPTVIGDVNLIKADYREEFAEKDQGWIIMSEIEAEKSWDLNLNVEFPANLWIKNNDIDAEVSGSINFIRERGKYRFIGSMEVLRGKGFMTGRTFRIDPGSTIHYEDIEYPNPTLDVTANTKIRLRGLIPDNITGEEVTESYDLCVHIAGTLDEPLINACEESRFSTNETITLLFTGIYTDEGGSGGGSDLELRTFAEDFGQSFGSQIFTQIGSRRLGVETFEIDPVFGEKFESRLTLGIYTNPNLYIYGRSGISGVAGQEVGFEYRLKRSLLLEGKVDEDRLYNLFLNLYWEY